MPEELTEEQKEAKLKEKFKKFREEEKAEEVEAAKKKKEEEDAAKPNHWMDSYI